MKKGLKLVLTSMATFCLCSCNEAKVEITEEQKNGIELKIDKNKNYQFEDVSNEEGSASYEIFVRSFYDSNGDGIGDFNGITEKLSYLKELGVKTLWLMPIHPSPSYHGYNVSDYYAVNSDYGTMEDFENLVKKARENNIDIMIDMVLNHSSTINKWFTQSYADFVSNNTSEDSKADWYNWSTTTGHKYKDLFYEGSFNSTMPDLNLDSPSLRVELEKVLKFWIDKGVSGYRLDATTYYYSSNIKKNTEFLAWIGSTCKKYKEDFYIVGECWADDSIVKKYYGNINRPTVDSFFKFSSAAGSTNVYSSLINCSKGNLKASTFSEEIEKYEKYLKSASKNNYSSYFLTNHDQDRSSVYFTDERAKSGASLYLLLPGTPFIYYGEEISLKGVRKTSPDDNSDVRRRLPLIWSKDDKTGECDFPESSRKDLSQNEQVELGINDQLNTNYSLLNHYKKVINVRNKYPFIKKGYYTNLVNELNTDEKAVLAYKIYLDDEYIIVVHNFSDHNVKVTSPGTEIVDQINTSRQIPKLENGELSLGYYSTVILK